LVPAAFSLLAALVAMQARPDARAVAAARRARLDELQRAFRARHARWREIASGAVYGAQIARLAAVRDELLRQRADREREFALARDAQLRLDHATFLAQFPIPRVPQVQGSLVTPSGPTTGIENRQMRELAMHGITNASHVSVAALRAIPHLRSWRFDVLIEWRTALDREFARLPVRELDYRVRHEIERRYARKRDEGRTELLAAPDRLRALSAALTREAGTLAAELPHDAAALHGARADAAINPLFYRT
jgi:hypothetical protein